MQVTVNGQPATAGCIGDVSLNITEVDEYDANVTVQIGDVFLASQQRWGAHSGPGWLMNVQFATQEQPSSSSASICNVLANRDNLYPFPQLSQEASLFSAEDYAVRGS